MSTIIAEDDVYPSPQVEGILTNWNLQFRLDRAFPIEKVEDVPGQQVRDAGNVASPTYVNEYFEQYQAGAKFPPIVLRDNGTIIDGNTRLAMWRKAGRVNVPAYLVTISSLDWARALGAQLNQIGGVRLTAEESMRQALVMMDDEAFTDQMISRIVGRSAQQVRTWRTQQEFKARVRRTGLEDQAAKLSAGQQVAVGKVKLDRPFQDLVKLASTRRIPKSELNGIVKAVEAAPSEDEMREVIAKAAVELAPAGPDGATVISNPKAKRMRMVLPQVVNLAPPDELYEADKAKEDRLLWLSVRDQADKVLAMYDRYLQT